MQFLFIFAQAHLDFRIPEIQSVAELHGFTVTLPGKDIDGPFMVAGLDEVEHARILASRCVLIKSIYEFYAQGSSYEEMHARNRENQSKWAPYALDTSFKFIVKAYNHGVSQSRQHQVVEGFSYMNLSGDINMANPQVIWGCFEEYPELRGQLHGRNLAGDFKQVYFGKLVAEGSARSLIGKFDVKKRAFYGNTSMEAEISLLMANQTLAAPGKLIYDPFMGSGSTAYTTAHFGALVFGSDIDGRQMRGKGKPPGIIRAATQYGVAQRIIDLCTFDVTHNPWRCGGLFDAIVTDPPYGVRAGAKRLGRRKERKNPLPQVRPANLPYIPPTKPYEFADLARDLVLLARYLLKPRGRLVFFLPTVTDEYEDIDVQTLLCENMEVIANSLQDFGSWGRRLITIQKTTSSGYAKPSFDMIVEENHNPAHRNFREKYFQGFQHTQEAVAQPQRL